MSDTSGHRPFTNDCQLGQVYGDLTMANYGAQVINLALKKCTFLKICTELVSAKVGQDKMEVCKCSGRIQLYTKISSKYTTTY